MSWPPIAKSAADWALPPNLADYEATYATFSWDAVTREMEGLPKGGLNMAHEAVDRQANGRLRDHLALRWLGKNGRVLDFTFGELQAESNRFANMLRKLDVGPRDTVFTLSGRTPALYVAALGTLKNTSVFCSLPSGFGPDAVRQRLTQGDARVLITTEQIYRTKVAELRPFFPQLRHVLLIDAEDDLEKGIWSLPRRMARASERFTIPLTSPDDWALLHFTSGTTGMPKGAILAHDAVRMYFITGKYVLDFHPDDIYWCTTDPGWVSGISYGIIAPWLHGVTSLVDEADFEAERWFRILEEQKVTVWYTMPTALRAMMRLPYQPRQRFDLRPLRFIASAGETLNPPIIEWARQALGAPIHDNWWQTETGGIIIANYAAMEIRPGSMGRPLPGIEAAIIQRRESGIEPIQEADAVGELALRAGWPSMFRGYLHEEERTKACFADGWYLTRDMVRRDAAGFYYFVDRADDVMNTAGVRVGPFEIETTLMEHPTVAEAGVISKPDPISGELIKAFVVLQPGIEGTEELSRELIVFARSKLGTVIAPKELEFVNCLPRTRTGKIMRRVLKMRELCLPEGDTSTLEPAA